MIKLSCNVYIIDSGVDLSNIYVYTSQMVERGFKPGSVKNKLTKIKYKSFVAFLIIYIFVIVVKFRIYGTRLVNIFNQNKEQNIKS